VHLGGFNAYRGQHESEGEPVSDFDSRPDSTPTVEECHGGHTAPPVAEHPDSLRPPMGDVLDEMLADQEFAERMEQLDAIRDAEARQRDAQRVAGVSDTAANLVAYNARVTLMVMEAAFGRRTA
jgi:hypothetical protein